MQRIQRKYLVCLLVLLMPIFLFSLRNSQPNTVPCNFFYVRMTVHRNRLKWIKPTDALNSNFIGMTTLHVSGGLSAHHQEFWAVRRLWYIICSCGDRMLPEVGWHWQCHPIYIYRICWRNLRTFFYFGPWKIEVVKYADFFLWSSWSVCYSSIIENTVLLLIFYCNFVI